MVQREFDFFWPLTEQIPLNLDYSRCVNPTLVHRTESGSVVLSSINGLGYQTWTTMEIDTDKVVFKIKNKPNIIRSAIMKIIGIR